MTISLKHCRDIPLNIQDNWFCFKIIPNSRKNISRPLVKDAKSDSIYQKYGIRGLIREYVTKEGVLKKEYFWDSSWEYIRYLFFQNNILFFYEHETPCFLISFFARADADSLEIFMKQNCTE
ncbi:hypothetical protein Q3C19_13380 [Bacteroides sp. ET489]|nr:hypothetical protein [Bacteroides sp. ET489]